LDLFVLLFKAPRWVFIKFVFGLDKNKNFSKFYTRFCMGNSIEFQFPTSFPEPKLTNYKVHIKLLLIIILQFYFLT
jgi:hypothetical protein